MGRDLLAMGMRQGPIIGEILKEIEEKRLEEQLKTPEEAKKWVEKTYFRHI
jgi:tRNA nucleotidyltransferase/poly(A) polymerase